MAAAEFVGYGLKAVPALRAFLFERDPSGIWQPRGWAVQALERIGAEDVLIEYLTHPLDVHTPVERFGELKMLPWV